MDLFDPAEPAAAGSGLFGLESPLAEARVRVVAVPFDATTSYRTGAAGAPAALLRASHQVDLFDVVTGRPYQEGIALVEAEERVAIWNAEARRLAALVRERRERGANPFDYHDELRRVNEIGAELNAYVHERVAEALDAGRLAIVLGGDHSVAFGSIHAHAQAFPGMGVLHFDAHHDLRRAYEGFEWSHASVLHNALARIPDLGPLLQVGIRDLSEEEHRAVAQSHGRVRAVYDPEWARARLEGADLRAFVRRQLACLPEEVYVSFDVDGLDQALCPRTGTPVPGGLTWHEAMLWLEELRTSGRQIVGADLVEVSPGEPPEETDTWDAIVGARLLYRLIGFALL